MTPDEVPDILVARASASLNPRDPDSPSEREVREILAGALPFYGVLLASDLAGSGMQQFDPVPAWALKDLRGETGV
jgi:hypothetical protein